MCCGFLIDYDFPQLALVGSVRTATYISLFFYKGPIEGT